MDGGQNLAGSRGIGRGLATAALLGAATLWGFSPIGTRLLVGDADASLPVMPMLAIRYGCAAILLLPLLWRGGAPGWTRRDGLRALWCGFLGITGYNVFASYGQRTVSAGMTGLLDAAEPLLILLFSAVAARRLPERRIMLAAIGGACGVVLLSSGVGPAQGDVKGIALVLAGAAFWAAYCVAVPCLIRHRGALAVTAATMLTGALPMAAAGAPGVSRLIHALTGLEALVLSGLVLGSSTLAMLFWNIGSGGIGAVQAGWFLYIIPAVSLIGGAILLGEHVTVWEILGGMIILISVIMTQKPITKK